MDELRAALPRAADVVADYRVGVGDARVTPDLDRRAVSERLGTALPDDPGELGEIIDELIAGAEPGLTATAGPRYFGFVIGGSLDAAVVADVLTTGWDQNAFNAALSPAALAFEDVAAAWLKELLRIPTSASVGFVTGAQGANTVGLAAGRWWALHEHGWDVGRDGLHGAPPVRVLAGAERHGTIDRSLRLLGLGEASIHELPADANGAMEPAALADALAGLEPGPTIVCAQAGNVNTGACDDLAAIGAAARDAGAWLHVDGAFGLWAAASPLTTSLVDGIELADSWACDGHKWLNVPYDSGYAFCAHPEVHATALAYTAAYLTGQDAGRQYGGGDLVLESSRRARGFATWAAIRALGRSGVTELVDRCCAHARDLAARLGAVDGIEIANDVVLNQVLIRVGDTQTTLRIEQRVQDEGIAWLGGTTWRGERLLRVSISNWSTSGDDVAATSDSIVRARAGVLAPA
jgi:glutamate/tyrosine decarboxylase-like PLP-dependent enzyme